MAIRKIPLVTSQIYHVFNKIQGDQQLFSIARISQAMLDALWYYQFTSVPMKLSHYRVQSKFIRSSIATSLENKPRNIEILAYCLMPNHYHLLLKQCAEEGISTYVGNIQNSITRFANTKLNQKGHIFIGQFKAVRMSSDEQLLHVSRYIHLNPFTGYVVKTIDTLFDYPYSSLSEYLQEGEGICNKKLVLSYFSKKNTYKKFIEDQKDYQRTLAALTHSVLENQP